MPESLIVRRGHYRAVLRRLEELPSDRVIEGAKSCIEDQLSIIDSAMGNWKSKGTSLENNMVSGALYRLYSFLRRSSVLHDPRRRGREPTSVDEENRIGHERVCILIAHLLMNAGLPESLQLTEEAIAKRITRHKPKSAKQKH